MRVNEIELAERLVEDEDFWIVDQRARQRHALRHAARQLMRIGVAERRQADEIERRIDALPLAFQDTLRLQAERDIVPDRAPGKQRGILKHDDPRRVRPLDADIVLAQHPATRRFQSGDEPQQCRLAAAGGTEQSDEFARRDRETDVFQDWQRGTVDIEFMADMLDIEFGTGGRICDHLRGGMRYHLTTPFCQTSKRSRVRNKSVMAPEHSNDITISAAYMLA